MKWQETIFYSIICSLLIACNPFQKSFFNKHFLFEESQYHHHTGFAIYDLEERQFLYQHDAEKYFTPASNTKIFTLYASLLSLGDSIPALKYLIQGDSLIFWGTGDPSLLNKNVHTNLRVLDFLNNNNFELYFSSDNYYDSHFGPGWAWDDYKYSYSAERSPMPIYGNLLEARKVGTSKSISINIPYFKRYFYLADTIYDTRSIVRNIGDNFLHYYPGRNKFDYSTPFHYSDYLFTQLLGDTLNKPVNLIRFQKPKNTKTLYSVPADSIYKVMMQKSDNFLAEQLLLLCSDAIGDSLRTTFTIQHIKESYLFDLPDEPIWRDGSGLSRYNLFTPRSVVALWEKIYQETGQERLFELLSVGGKSGTLKNYYKADPPYIYGKTGTLSNNHSLSGFLITKTGKILIFSYMNNNYPVSSSEIKPAMERFLWAIHEKY
ncbi:MAG: D-alanyl-D-alanine carboxypeptidase [Cyclobacteriaceae bacterium]|nr:D-alanyl-D-alanine carboxypeptidase [Cyclobacteriaceae bacterium]